MIPVESGYVMIVYWSPNKVVTPKFRDRHSLIDAMRSDVVIKTQSFASVQSLKFVIVTLAPIHKVFLAIQVHTHKFEVHILNTTL